MRCPDCGSHMDMEEGIGYVCAHCGTDTPEDFIGRSNSQIVVIENWRTTCFVCGKMVRVERKQEIGDDQEELVVVHQDIRLESCPGCGTDVDQIVLRGAA